MKNLKYLGCILLVVLLVIPVVTSSCKTYTNPENNQIFNVEQLYTSTVYIGIPYSFWMGTGYVQASDSTHSYVVTARHVTDSIEVTTHTKEVTVGILNEQRIWIPFPGTVLGSRGGSFSSEGDCALIQIDKVLKPLPLVSPKDFVPNVGDEVLTSGCMLDWNRTLPYPVAVVTYGSVTELSRVVGNSFFVNSWAMPGFSGGPVWSKRLNGVIGIIAWGKGSVPSQCPDASTIYELFTQLKLEGLLYKGK